MKDMMDYPVFVFAFSLVALWVSERTGAYFRRRQREMEEGVREDLGVILAASLTLLALIVGFSFSMAVNRYDQRKNYEEAEANAIGTEYARAGLLPAADATRVRDLLRSYVDQRVLFHTTQDARRLEQINARTSELQTDLWSAVQTRAAAQPTPTLALTVSGMNDVLNSQGYTQAAWWNRIPIAAWALMGAIAVGCNLLVGYNARLIEGKIKRFFILPLIVSVAFFLIAEMDSPRHGVIRVSPQNLISVSQSLRAL